MDSASHSSSVWRSGGPASPNALEQLAASYPGLPAEYLVFLRADDGSEGDLGVAPHWIQFWPARDVALLNERYDLPALLPGFLGFGSSGGSELLAFDTLTEPWRVCMIPFVPLEPAVAIEIATDFRAMALQFGRMRTAG